MVRIGFEWLDDIGMFVPLEIDQKIHCNWLVTGKSGSGKSTLILMALKDVLCTPVRLFIADYKGSGDYRGLTPDYAEFGDCVGLMERFYSAYQEIKDKKTGERIILLFDEWPGFLLWLEGIDKQKANSMKNMLSEALMVGRDLGNGGQAAVICLMQRADSEFFKHGVRLNFMVSICMGRVSRESRGMLFPGEDFPEPYAPRLGEGVVSEDGRSLRFFQVPKFDKGKMVSLLRRKAGART